jgi:mono/diheme cytochrome c family protein
MTRKLLPRLTLLALALAAALAGCAQRTASSKPLLEERTVASTPKQPPANNNVGRDLFIARCGSCHDERGDKPLRTGLPLNQRKLSREVISKAVRGRLKSRTEAEQQAVIEYIASLYVDPKN